MAAVKFLRFATTLSNVECALSGQVQVIRFLEGAPRASVVAEDYFTGPGKFSFEVFMKDKKAKTAVGFLSESRTTAYMRDDPIGETHVSFGGAGWIHPKEIAAGKKYTEGDRVKTEVDFDKSVVNFYVNGEYVGQDEWLCNKAYPAVSVNGGICELEVTF